MTRTKGLRLALVSAAALMAGAAISEANAGAFGIREQSTYFMGDAYAGAAAGGDISSMFWNPAATATFDGFNSSTSITGIIGTANEHATGGILVTGTGTPPTGTFPYIAPGSPTSTDVGTSAIVPASYYTVQLTDRLYAGLGLNAPFGLVTKPDNLSWAGSAIATTTRVFSLEATPTLAYKLTPTLTIGAGIQVEYFQITLEHGPTESVLGALLPPNGAVLPSRAYSRADDVGVGGTAGAIWQPMPGTSVGLGYRSAVTVDVSALYLLGQSASTPLGFGANANGQLTLPDEVTLSARQAITPQLALLGTVEWDRWSSLGNVSATSTACGGACETLNLNYKDGWYFSAGAEYAYSPSLTLRTGVGYEISPITSSTRDILLPDANRINVSVGASYKWSEKLTLIAAYSHLFFDNETFCMANPLTTGNEHCTALTSAANTLLSGTADVSVDIVSLGMNYKFYGPAPLEPLK
jgi:long-chain fatty acid transport protein